MSVYPLPSMLIEDQGLLLRYVESSCGIEGDVAEAGVYNGGSAWLIWSAIKDSGKELYLLDSFEGLAPEAEDYPLGGVGLKWYKGDELFVKKLFLSYPKVHVMKGDCVELTKALEDKSFSLVHLDLDLYRPTKLCLEFFLERMAIGGRILVHDARTMTGVLKALREAKHPYAIRLNYAIFGDPL